MLEVPFGLYDAFTDNAFGGSQAGVVSDAAWIDSNTRLKIARELGFPATCFVTDHNDHSITARFQSTKKEYSMCGHGTICLMTRMIEMGILDWQGRDRIEAQLRIDSSISPVEIFKREDGRALVMLDINPPSFHNSRLDKKLLAKLLSIRSDDFDNTLPIESAHGDFIHLVVPVNGLHAMGRIEPDFPNLKKFCLDNAIETVAVFCKEVKQSGYNIHVRDFCPAVGVAESAAAGTTNAALTSYLIRHNLMRKDAGEQLIVLAEQGLEINRPSSIRSVVSMNAGMIERLQVGGVATKVFDGKLHLPASKHDKIS
jgi:trans-2,3-dihydro-3-hydroxyanthranilate isomerase